MAGRRGSAADARRSELRLESGRGTKIEMPDRKCFVISPIGEPGSTMREQADDVLEYIIQPALKEINISAVRADKLAEPGLITNQMIEAILTYDLCIADLSGHNPNVFYELAIAQTAARPVVLMKRLEETIPFDIKDYRRVDYDLKLKNISKWVSTLTDQVAKVLEPAYKVPRLIPEKAYPDLIRGPVARATAKSFFLSLDDKDATSFPAFVEGAIGLQVLARTIVNLVGQYANTFASLARAGCDVQLLIVNPDSEAARHVYSDNHDLYLQNARTALAHLAKLQRSHPDHVRIRFFSRVPTMSLVNVRRRESEESSAQLQFYFAHGDIGRDRRPIFRIHRSDPWYDVFCKEFDSIWDEVPDADVPALLAKQRL
jgi:hypothetical protein